MLENRRRNSYDEYEFWLLRQVGFHGLGYDLLMHELHLIPFKTLLNFDENRANDGLYLRDEFGREYGFYHVVFEQPCSVLEMLVALAIRIEEDYIGDPREFHPERIFWEMICNLGLDLYDDSNFDRGKVYDILQCWMKREFSRNGEGSIFPLKMTKRDQRKVEIWGQMNEYLIENYPV